MGFCMYVCVGEKTNVLMADELDPREKRERKMALGRT